jgi:protein-tyrosine phosphatase
MYRFSAASYQDQIVFGSARPGYSDRAVQDWLLFMQGQGIKRICCLLTLPQINRYSNLEETYNVAFGSERICWAAIEDFSYVDPIVFRHEILPFLNDSNRQQEKVLVHCSGGVGRTGHVLAAWLVAGRGFSKVDAIVAVKQMGRNPYEAIMAAPFLGKNPWAMAARLDQFLDGYIVI